MDDLRPKAEETSQEILSPWKLGWRSFKRDRMGFVGGGMVLLILLVAVLGDTLAPDDPLKMIYEDSFQSPSSVHLVGTDRFGRDQLSRIVSGTRASVVVSFGAVIFSVIVGLIIGLVSGYFGGKVDSLTMRILDVAFAFPPVLLALTMVAAFGPSTVNLVLIIGVIFGARMARVVRGSTLSVKEKDYIEAVRAVGARDVTIMRRFVLPNILGPVTVQATFNLSTAIMIEAALSFLGLGTQPPFASWGQMLNESRAFVETAPWLAVFPGLAIVFAVLAFNFLGDALTDALDPRLSQR